MSQWVYRGLKTGIVTTRYPEKPDSTPGVTPGLPKYSGSFAPGGHELAAICPTKAIAAGIEHISIDYHRCVHCYRCQRETEHPLEWSSDYEWAMAVKYSTESVEPENVFGSAFNNSVHIKIVDAGDCGACLHEVRKLDNPFYNFHRLGFFITPSPRHADILLVVGTGTDPMRFALEKTYEAMPTPKKVIAVGACALSGSVFGPSFATSPGIADIVPIDIAVPGHPPPPLAILHALLVAVGRRPPAPELEPLSIKPIMKAAE